MTFRHLALVVVLIVLLAPIAEAQTAAPTMRRIGILSPAPEGAEGQSPFTVFREALRDLGYVEGKNIAFEYRFANGYRRLPELATELARIRVDVIVTDGGSIPARAASNATKSIPIVMGTVGPDPVGEGLVTTLARPGGNITGFALTPPEQAGRRLQILKEMLPAVTRVAVLWDAETSSSQFQVAEAAARSLGVQLQSLPIRRRDDLEAAFEAATRHQARALLQLPSRMLSDHKQEIVERAVKRRLPGIFELGYERTDALASYGTSVADNFRRAAGYVHKILEGTPAGHLPVQLPVKFDLVINLKTAKALGVTIPPSVLLQATRVIE